MIATSGETSARIHTGFGVIVRPATLGPLVTIALFILLFWPSIAWMAGEWTESSGLLSHGYLVAAIAGYLIVRSLHAMADSPLGPVWWLLPVVFGMSIVWLLASVANVAAVQTMILPVMLLATITAAFGFAVGKLTSFGVLYLYFAMPAWEHLQFVFQEITVVAVHVLIRLVDIPAYVEGKFVHIPAGTFEVDGGCSGLSFVIAGLSLAVLYGHLYYKNWKQKLWLAALTVVVSMIGNWIRVFFIVNVGYLKGMDSELVSDHLTLGWVIFAVLMVPVFFAARRLESEDTDNMSRRSGQFDDGQPGNGISWTAAATAIVIASTGPVWAKVAASTMDESQSVSISLPKNVAGWRGPIETAWDWRPRFIGATAERIAEYRRNNKVVLSYANVYATQAQGKELIFHQNTILGAWRRNRDAAAIRNITVEEAGPFQVEMADSPHGSWIILHRYVIDGEPVVGNLRGKIRQSLASLQGKPEAGVIAFAIPCVASCADSMSDLTEFVSLAGQDATIKFEIESR